MGNAESWQTSFGFIIKFRAEFKLFGLDELVGERVDYGSDG